MAHGYDEKLKQAKKGLWKINLVFYAHTQSYAS